MGRHIHISVGSAQDLTKAKFKITLDAPALGAPSPALTATALAMLQVMRHQVLAGIATDRGHKHSHGKSVISIWIQLVTSATALPAHDPGKVIMPDANGKPMHFHARADPTNPRDVDSEADQPAASTFTNSNLYLTPQPIAAAYQCRRMGVTDGIPTNIADHDNPLDSQMTVRHATPASSTHNSAVAPSVRSCASSDDDADEEIEDAPVDLKRRDPLLGKRISKMVDGRRCDGLISDIEIAKRSRALLYLVEYDDGDIEHFQAEDVCLYVIE